MVPVNGRDVIRLLVAGVLSAALYGFWLTTPVLEYVSQNQWRAFAIVIAALLGILCSMAKWNLSILVARVMTGLLVGGTAVALPPSHGRISNAFKANLELLGGDMIAFTFAAAVSWYCVSCLRNKRRRDNHPNGS
jgi:uncharacterized membrane protein